MNQIKKYMFGVFKIFTDKYMRQKQKFYLIRIYRVLFNMKKYIFFILEKDFLKYSQHQKKS